MTRPRYCIGIDPGVNTGWAVWDRADKKLLTIATLCPADAILGMRDYTAKCGADAIEVIFEDARLRKWFGNADARTQRSGPGIREGVGMVKARCADIEDACRILNIKCTAVKPGKGMTKWSADYFAKITGWKGRTSEHARDAAVLVFGK